jgi:hypothetical protein
MFLANYGRSCNINGIRETLNNVTSEGKTKRAFSEKRDEKA